MFSVLCNAALNVFSLTQTPRVFVLRRRHLSLSVGGDICFCHCSQNFSSDLGIVNKVKIFDIEIHLRQ